MQLRIGTDARLHARQGTAPAPGYGSHAADPLDHIFLLSVDQMSRPHFFCLRQSLGHFVHGNHRMNT